MWLTFVSLFVFTSLWAAFKYMKGTVWIKLLIIIITSPWPFTLIPPWDGVSPLVSPNSCHSSTCFHYAADREIRWRYCEGWVCSQALKITQDMLTCSLVPCLVPGVLNSSRRTMANVNWCRGLLHEHVKYRSYAHRTRGNQK